MARIRELEEELYGHQNELKKTAGHKYSLEQENQRLLAELEELRNKYNDLVRLYGEAKPYIDKCRQLEERLVMAETEI